MNTSSIKVLKAVSYVFTAVTAACLIFLLLPFTAVKPILDSIPADGTLEMFTEKVHSTLKWGAVLVMGFSGAAVYFSGFQKERTLQGWKIFRKWVKENWHRLKSDALKFSGSLAAFLPKGKALYLLLGLILAGVILRLLMISKPMSHDESYTFVAFASQSFSKVISDYHLPNNHIFHTILVFFSTRLFGVGPFAIRLPALVFGVLLIPAAFIVSKRVFNRQAGWLAAAAAAVFPYFLMFSTDGRGYTLQALLFLCIWLLALYIKDHKNLFGWMLFVLLSALGFYTIPTMLYPFGMVLGWLFFSWAVGNYSKEYSRGQFFGAMFTAGLGVVIITLLLYISVITNSGLDSLLGNSIVESETLSAYGLLFENVASRGVRAWQEWSLGFGGWFAGLTLVLVLMSVLLKGKTSKDKIHLLIPGMLWIAAVVLLQKVMPWRRIWFFLSPIYFIFAFGLLEFWLNRLLKVKFQKVLMFSLIMAVFFFAAVQWQIKDVDLPGLLVETPGQVEQVADFLSKNADEKDMIVDGFSDGPTLRYFAGYQYGMALSHFDITKGPFERVFAVVKPGAGQSIEANFLIRASSLLDKFNPDDVELVYETDQFEIYLIELIP